MTGFLFLCARGIHILDYALCRVAARVHPVDDHSGLCYLRMAYVVSIPASVLLQRPRLAGE
jgi:hypothetical protein